VQSIPVFAHAVCECLSIVVPLVKGLSPTLLLVALFRTNK
jgi:hypothetical protein